MALFDFNNRHEDRPDFVRYTILVVVMIFFVILYVWQNIEVMQTKMYYEKSIEYKKELIKKRDRLLYDIERYKRLGLIEAYAEQNGLQRMGPENAVRIVDKEENDSEK